MRLRSSWASSSPRSAPFCGEAALAAVCRLMPLPSLTIETGGGVEVSTNPAKGAPTTGKSASRGLLFAVNGSSLDCHPRPSPP